MTHLYSKKNLRKLCLLAGLFLSFYASYAGEIIISGIYQGKNIFVQNPFSPDKKSYCADEVYVNDQKTISNIKLAAFEIDLSFLEMNTPVTIRITHKDGCAPRLINPQVIRPSAGFQIDSVEVLHTSIRWKITDETPKFVYYIESLRNGNWLVLEKHNANGQGQAVYSVPVMHSNGDNKYRVKAQNTDTHQTFYSRTITFNPETAPPPPPVEEVITFAPANPTDLLTLSKETDYEIVDSQKKVILKGKGQKINIKTLKAGAYVLKTGTQNNKFVKK
ncbi:hypothetical protein QNI19_19420 [Cytophagaceae bacterium DM2B3-1]|uniref:T9SS C-terminal target domain-containing protein n=1 Tax=Xanthocytophaga flava TaxID=3048013 RepID=A0ABT7CN36_9BACT|nr:hypothetical protein [Xanthocytophaga flavus]MDJ1472121.1 hypothetical protein [Xanthocytophaga flavus]MDJ1495118.1 hypothetical protein [Xanthocytophaga flavus]